MKQSDFDDVGGISNAAWYELQGKLFDVYVAGFLDSGEGLNAEYMDGNAPPLEQIKEYLKPKFDEYVRTNMFDDETPNS